MRKKECSKCDQFKESDTKRYCNNCSAAFMREWRKTHKLSPAQEKKAKVRRATHMRISRGYLIPKPCEVCGIEKVEAHHNHYEMPERGKPFDLRWLCFKHHREHHKNLRMSEHGS